MLRMRGPTPASVWMLCLMALWWTLPVSAQESTSPAKSEGSLMVPLETCLEEVTRLELECTRRLTQQEHDFKLLLYESNQKAAAEAVKAVMVELAGVEAERDAAVREALKWKGLGIGASIGAGVGLIGLVISAIVCAVR